MPTFTLKWKKKKIPTNKSAANVFYFLNIIMANPINFCRDKIVGNICGQTRVRGHRKWGYTCHIWRYILSSQKLFMLQYQIVL